MANERKETRARCPRHADTTRRHGAIALSVTTVGILAATLNSSILLISLPAIFSGLGLDPLAPQNISYLLWMLMGFLLVTAVLVVTFGRLGDQYGRAKLFNLGFLIFTVGSVGCALVPNSGAAGALEIIMLRVVQGVGGAMVIGQLDGADHRRLPARAPRLRPRRQPGRGPRRVVPRPGHRRRAVASGTGARCSG